ncbi:MAG: flagellar assembly protein FliW [Clostridia bacterium]|nr:flagellar assembly protein FliW [Clostridia bacterium]
MIIPTKIFGNVQIEQDDIFTFVKPILGFEEYKYFVILEHKDKHIPFKWLQSVEVSELSFVVVDPKIFLPDYQPAVRQNVLKPLDIESQQDIVLYSIVVVPEDIKKMTANLKSPLVFNMKNKTAIQLVLDDRRYGLRHYIMRDLQHTGEKGKRVCSY